MSFTYKLCSLDLNFGNDKKVWVGDLYIDPLNVPNREDLAQIFANFLSEASSKLFKISVDQTEPVLPSPAQDN